MKENLRRNRDLLRITQALKPAVRCFALMVLVAVTAPAAIQPTTTGSSVSMNSPGQSAISASPTYYHDVQPILQTHCVACHTAGGIAPMSFATYETARQYAFLIRNVAQDKAMPPAFAVPLAGEVANNPALSSEQISILAAWANAHAPEGTPPDKNVQNKPSSPWTISKPDMILRTPAAIDIPGSGGLAYVYEIVPTRFRASRWVQMAEVLPSSRTNVLQIVVVVRRHGSSWLRSAPTGEAFTAPRNQADFRWANDDILAVFAPGSPVTRLPSHTAKLIPAGADLVFRVQYEPNGAASSLQMNVGLVFSKQKPLFRAATFALENTELEIPPEAGDYQAEARGILARDLTLLNLFPALHLRGKQFEFDVSGPAKNPSGKVLSSSPLLRVNYDRRWQPAYPLSQPLVLRADTRLRALATYDNSPTNPANPDAHASVHWGSRTEDEVLQLFFDAAIPAHSKKDTFLIPD